MHARADALQGVKRGQPGCETVRRKPAGNKRLQRAAATCLPQPPKATATTCISGRGKLWGTSPGGAQSHGAQQGDAGGCRAPLHGVPAPKGWVAKACVCVCAPCPPSSLALPQSRRLTHLLNQRSSPRPLPRPPSFKDINILLLFIGRNMQMNACGKALESSNVNKTSKQGLSSLRAMLTQYTSVVLQSITS